jgi:hypothetical protein
MDKKLKKKMIITQREHDAWHKKHGGYGKKSDKNNKISKEHELCHKKMGIVVKKR